MPIYGNLKCFVVTRYSHFINCPKLSTRYNQYTGLARNVPTPGVGMFLVRPVEEVVEGLLDQGGGRRDAMFVGRGVT